MKPHRKRRQGCALEIVSKFSQGKFPEALAYTPDSSLYKSVWQDTIKAAEEFNEPGRFTAFIGFEWTSMVTGNNMHRVVIYRDDAAKASQMTAYTTTAPQGSANPRDLWKWMTVYKEKTGGDLLAIAHNGNLSNGILFPLEAQYDGTKLDLEYVNERAKWEPLYETTQINKEPSTMRGSSRFPRRAGRPTTPSVLALKSPKARQLRRRSAPTPRQSATLRNPETERGALSIRYFLTPKEIFQ